MRGVNVLGVAVAALILSAPDARAGGVPVQLAAVRSTLWAVSDNGLLAVDLRTSRIVARPELPYADPIRVAAGPGALWVASVANGYVSGAVTRIDARTGHASTRLLLPHRPIYDLCAGGGATWAIVGPWRRARIARIASRGGRARFLRLPTAPGWCAADARGPWFAGRNRLLHVDPRTNAVSRVAYVPGLGPVAAGRGAVWGTCPACLARIDERTGRVARIAIGAVVFAVALGRSNVWALAIDNRNERTTLLRIDPRTMRIRDKRRLPGNPSSILEYRGVLWIGGLDRRRDPTLLRADSRTLVVLRAISLL